MKKVKLPYIDHPSFADRSKHAEILGPMPGDVAFQEAIRTAKAPKNTAPEIAVAYLTPLLARDQEAHLFRKMNLHRYLAAEALKKSETLMRYIKRPNCKHRFDLAVAANKHHEAEAQKIHNLIVMCNYRLTISTARKLQVRAPYQEFFHIVSDCNIILIRAVRKFDFSRGNRFSTYACKAMFLNFVPDKPLPSWSQLSTEHYCQIDPLSSDPEPGETVADSAERKAGIKLLNKLLLHLDRRERLVITARYQLLEPPAGKDRWTLETIGKMLGVTKERARQLTLQAFKQMRLAAANLHQPPE